MPDDSQPPEKPGLWASISLVGCLVVFVGLLVAILGLIIINEEPYH